MSTIAPSGKMDTLGRVLSWLAGSALGGTLVFFGGSALADGRMDGALARLANELGPALVYLILTAEAVALAILVVGVVCWPGKVIYSPRWMLSALALGLVAAAVFVLILIAAGIATGSV